MDAPQLRSLQIDDVAPVELAPGCTRRGLPSSGQVLVRVIDMAPGTRWPVVDRHDRDELIYIVSGEVIEGHQRYGAGTYLYYQPGTHHQPYTETGVRMFIVGPATPAEPGRRQEQPNPPFATYHSLATRALVGGASFPIDYHRGPSGRRRRHWLSPSVIGSR